MDGEYLYVGLFGVANGRGGDDVRACVAICSFFLEPATLVA